MNMSSRNNVIQTLSILAGLLITAAFAMVLFYAPIELNMGLVQKVFYFHMAAAWVGMLAFLGAVIFAIQYLRTRDLKWNYFEASSIEIGLIFTMVCNFSGMIWAKAAWNTWWTWDPRLTTTTIMAFTYIAYLLLRRGVDDPQKRAQFGAIYAIIGFATVPLVFFSARLLRTIHPVLFGTGAGMEMNLTPEMLHTMIVSVIAFSVLYVAVLLFRQKLMTNQETLKEAHQMDEEN